MRWRWGGRRGKKERGRLRVPLVLLTVYVAK